MGEACQLHRDFPIHLTTYMLEDQKAQQHHSCLKGVFKRTDLTVKIQTPTPEVKVTMKGENHTRHPVGKCAIVHKEKSSLVTGEIYIVTGNNNPINQVVRGTGLEIAEDQMDQKTEKKIVQMQNGRSQETGGDHHEDLIKKRRKRKERII